MSVHRASGTVEMLSHNVLMLAIDQRRRLSFASALLLFEAAHIVAMAEGQTERSEDYDALGEHVDGLLRAAEAITVPDAENLLSRARRVLETEPALEDYSLASVAAIIGQADVSRLLGKPKAAAAFLDNLQAAPDESTAALAEAPATTVRFLLEVCSGCGEDEFGGGRADVMVEIAYRMEAAPRAPEIIWCVLGASCKQRPAPSADAYEVVAVDASWSIDDNICASAVEKVVNPECVLEAAIKCVWGRRPKDAIVCLERLEELASLQFWTPPHSASMPKQPNDDRVLTAKALAARAAWLFSAGMRDEAFSSYSMSSRVLYEEWRADPLAPAALRLFIDVSWRASDLTLEQSERTASEALLEVRRGSAARGSFRRRARTFTRFPRRCSQLRRARSTPF